MKTSIYFDGDKIRLVPSIPENAVFDSNNILLDDKLKGLLLDMHNVVEEYLNNHPELIFDEEVLAKTNKNVSDLSKQVEELKLFKFPNLTIIGNPTINHGQVSDFSSDNYLILPSIFDNKGRSFEVNVAFTTDSNVTAAQNIIGGKFCMALYVQNEKLTLRLSSNGKDWNILSKTSEFTVKPNTTYFIKVVFDRLQYKLLYSTDGINYTQDWSVTNTLEPYPGVVYFGVGNNFFNPFQGIINLNKCDIKFNNTIVWQGMDDVGLATRLATDLSNLDEEGENVLRQIIRDELNKS